MLRFNLRFSVGVDLGFLLASSWLLLILVREVFSSYHQPSSSHSILSLKTLSFDVSFDFPHFFLPILMLYCQRHSMSHIFSSKIYFSKTLSIQKHSNAQVNAAKFNPFCRCLFACTASTQRHHFEDSTLFLTHKFFFSLLFCSLSLSVFPLLLFIPTLRHGHRNPNCTSSY